MLKKYQIDEIQIKVNDNETDNKPEDSESESSESKDNEAEDDNNDKYSSDIYEDCYKVDNRVATEYETASDEFDEYETASETSESYNREIYNEGDELLKLLFSLYIAFNTEQLINSQPSSTILGYFNGILGFSVKSQVFRPTRIYIPYLSGLVYIQQFLFLEYTLLTRNYPTLGIYRRPKTGQLTYLKPIRRKYMVAGL
jgi:hypothetical protein